MKKVKVSTYNACDLWDSTSDSDLNVIKDRLQKRRAQLRNHPELVKLRRFKHGNMVHSFNLIDTFNDLKDAMLVLAVLSQKDHMTRIMKNKGKYEVWSRTI